MSFGKHMYAFLLSTYLGMELLIHNGCICIASVDTAKSFSKWLYQFTFASLVYSWQLSIGLHKTFRDL